jgi:hypothetical protein
MQVVQHLEADAASTREAEQSKQAREFQKLKLEHAEALAEVGFLLSQVLPALPCVIEVAVASVAFHGRPLLFLKH